MADAVIDSSTLLAILFDEAGARAAGNWLEPEAAMSAVNWAEALTPARDRSKTGEDWIAPLVSLRRDAGLVVVPFDEEQANVTAALRDRTILRGLSSAIERVLHSRLSSGFRWLPPTEPGATSTWVSASKSSVSAHQASPAVPTQQLPPATASDYSPTAHHAGEAH